MGAVTAAGLVARHLVLTDHPLQRCGAWAVAVLAGRPRPSDLTSADLDGAVTRLVDDVVAAATAPKSAAAYDWWKVLFALYPNSKPTHAGRSRDRHSLREQIVPFFAPDRSASLVRACTFCASPAGAVWSKAQLPMFDTSKALNTLPPDVSGWPVCRGCRIALWALPYGAWVTAGSATVLMCGSPDVERNFVAKNVSRASRIRQLGFSGLSADASAETVTLAVLRTHAPEAPVDAALWSFKNDNQEPWLRLTVTRQATARLLQRIEADPACRLGWRRLRGVLARREKAGSGYAAVARTLFDDEQRHVDRLLRELYRQVVDVPGEARALDGWRRLARAYQEEMYGMEIERLAPARRLVTEWITAEANPRGRFNEYKNAAPDGYALHKLLMQASARLLLDGRKPADVSAVAPVLLANGQDGWRWRAQLFFEVVADLVKADAGIARHKPDDVDVEEESTDAMRFHPDDEEERSA